MTTQIPKAVKLENMANVLKIEFDNGEVKYLKSHYVKEMSDAFSVGEGAGKRTNLLMAARNAWMGATFEIADDGTVTMNEKDVYTPAELWEESQDSIPEL